MQNKKPFMGAVWIFSRTIHLQNLYSDSGVVIILKVSINVYNVYHLQPTVLADK